MTDSERIDVLEKYVIKHFAALYAEVRPKEVPDLVQGMRTIYRGFDPMDPLAKQQPKADTDLMGIYKKGVQGVVGERSPVADPPVMKDPPKPPEEVDPRAKAMESIYTHHSSRPRKPAKD